MRHEDRIRRSLANAEDVRCDGSAGRRNRVDRFAVDQVTGAFRAGVTGPGVGRAGWGLLGRVVGIDGSHDF